MGSPWRSEAQVIADRTFLSIREAETILAFDELSNPKGIIPPSKETVYAEIADELGVEATTIRTYLARARSKMERGVATAKAVEDPHAFRDDEQPAESLSEWRERQSNLPTGAEPAW